MKVEILYILESKRARLVYDNADFEKCVKDVAEAAKTGGWFIGTDCAFPAKNIYYIGKVS